MILLIEKDQLNVTSTLKAVGDVMKNVALGIDVDWTTNSAPCNFFKNCFFIL